MLPIIENAKKEILDALVGFSSSFEQWRQDWTKERAERLDYLDAPISTRARQDVQGDVTSRNLTTVMGRLGSIVGYGELVMYTTPGSHSFTVPDGVLKMTVTIVSGGGGGGGGSHGDGPSTSTRTETEMHGSIEGYNPLTSAELYLNSGASGGSGAIMQLELPVTPGQTFPIVVGRGGTGGAGASSRSGVGSPGTAGGSSSFGGHACSGGGGGGGGVSMLAARTDNRGPKPPGRPIAGAAGKALGDLTLPNIKYFAHGAGGSYARRKFSIMPIRDWYSEADRRRYYYRKYPDAGQHNGDNIVDIKQTTNEFINADFAIPRFYPFPASVTGSVPQLIGTELNGKGKGGNAGEYGTVSNYTIKKTVIYSDFVYQPNGKAYYTDVTADATGTAGQRGGDGSHGVVAISY